MRLSLVIVNFHSIQYVRTCLASVDASWCRQVVLVDNSVDPDEAEQLAAIVLPVPLEVLVEPDNLGFGEAANHGIDLAFRNDPISPAWLVNPDMSFTAATPQSLLARLNLRTDDIVSPPIVTGQQGDLRVWFSGGSVDRDTGDVVHDDYLKRFSADQSFPTRATSFMCGAAPVFTRAAWEQLQGFRRDLFLYWEDAELSLRAQDLRLRMTVVGSAPPVWHAVGGTGHGSGQSVAFYYFSARNRVMVIRERNGLRAVLTPLVLVQTTKFVLRPLRRERTQRILKSFKAMQGHFDGFRAIPRQSASRT